ncbi:CRISPR-associated protein Cas1 [Methanosarcina horonobensis HB-1 = JCM 15518]|uniref:CRISPR-associated endonuclease Cas1 n=1 Tax=Methanosarcina horonobensis HB-1 = JCM 15518 TaxID=1434110 RepID=A0A0E3SC70_9EURY|nr:CRISPR-associated protein Cas1 [Methanosarcina horonobensis HB-1 = JCM 15518]
MDKTEKLLKKGFSADKVSQILIYTGAAVTADAIELAVKKGIDIVYLDRMGKPFARTYSCGQENSATVQRYQARAYDDGKGIFLMSSMIGAKIRNQAYFLKSLAKNRDNERLAGQAERIMSQAEKIKKRAEEWGYIEEARDSLFGIEGEASRIYFQALSNVLPEAVYSGTRTKRPPGDLFNAMLSYGYGILYTEVEKACILSGLNPYMGFLHTDLPGKPSLVLDLIEEFRQPVVDRSVLSLISKNLVTKNDLKPVEGGFYLNRAGRHKTLEAVSERLAKVINYRDFRHSFSSLVLLQARAVSKFLTGERNGYAPFVYWR